MIPLLVAALAHSAAPSALPEGPALTQAVRTADEALFDLFFNRCDPPALAAMVAPDFRMYHDRDGVVATTGQAFVATYAEQCTARQAPDAWRSRRELVADSLHVDPVPGYGAIEEGDHLFYERRGDGPEQLVGRAHFVQLWRLEDGRWRLALVLSYAHRAAGAGAEPQGADAAR